METFPLRYRCPVPAHLLAQGPFQYDNEVDSQAASLNLAITTISFDMQAAPSAASFFNLCKHRANDRPTTSIVNSGFAEKVGSTLPSSVKRRSCHHVGGLTPERVTMLAFLTHPFVSSLLDQTQVNFQRNRRDGLGH